MNPRQQKFAELIVAGQTAKAAYFESFPRCRSEKTAETEGSKLLNKPKVQEFIASLRWELGEKTKSDLIATKREVLEFLTSVMRTPAGSVDEEHELCQSFKHTSAVREIKIPDKIAAVKELCHILGFTKNQIELTGDGLTQLLECVRAGK